MSELDEQLAPALQYVSALETVTAAWIPVAYSHHGRVHAEAAFAALAGAAPLQGLSGNRECNRLNLYGGRQLNKEFEVVARTRVVHGETTKRNAPMKALALKKSNVSANAISPEACIESWRILWLENSHGRGVTAQRFISSSERFSL